MILYGFFLPRLAQTKEKEKEKEKEKVRQP
jgi:hypothetical protein